MEKTRIRYFGYSSTLKEDHMREHGIKFDGGKRAVLKGWKLVFSIHLEDWNGGVADIIPDEQDHNVEGVVFNTDLESLDNLDDYLGRVVAADKEVGVFRRQYIHVEMGGELIPILTHVGNKVITSKGEKKVAPTEEYMDLLIKGAEEQGLSPNYIDELKSYKKILTIPLEEDD